MKLLSPFAGRATQGGTFGGRNSQIILGPAHEGSTPPKENSDERSWNSNQKTREGCGCPKFFAGRCLFLAKLRRCWKIPPQFQAPHNAILAKVLGTFFYGSMASAGNRLCLREFSWIFSSPQPSRVFLLFVRLLFCKSAALNNFRTNDICIRHAGLLEINSRECFDATGFDSIA